jgi:hypothetical protein
LGFLDSSGYKFVGQGGALKGFNGSFMVMKVMKIRNRYKLEGKTKTSEALVVSNKVI